MVLMYTIRIKCFLVNALSYILHMSCLLLFSSIVNISYLLCIFSPFCGEKKVVQKHVNLNLPENAEGANEISNLLLVRQVVQMTANMKGVTTRCHAEDFDAPSI